MRKITTGIFCVIFSFATAQDDLLGELQSTSTATPEYVFATFKATRLVNLHTVETLSKGSLDFRIAHRFGPISNGIDGFFGLDGPATVQLHADYSITDRLVIGVGRTSDQKMIDAFVKYKWLRQKSNGKMPVTLTTITSLNVTAKKNNALNQYKYFSSRMAYYAAVMVARKFSPAFSLQLSPSVIHYNLVPLTSDSNDIFHLGIATRYMLSRSIAFTLEYTFPLNEYREIDPVNVLSVGFDIETGGHVFQIFFTNGYSINEVLVIPYTTAKWSKSEMRLGFNISRVFAFGKK